MPNNNSPRIYTTQGDKKALIGVRAMIDGRLCLAYIKDNHVISYEFYENLCKQLLDDGPIGIINPLTKEIRWSSDSRDDRDTKS